MHRLLAALLSACLLAAPAAHADSARTLGWEDLLPKLAPFDDPFEKLTQDQYYQFGNIVFARELKASGRPVADVVAQRAREAEQALRKAGVDVDGMMARHAEIRAERLRRAKAVNAALDGARVRMPGYVLPLEYDGRKVREFLLVPWVGACIHTPPPPPNQIVHVRMAKGAEFDSRGNFAAVWVTGVLSARASRPTLNFVDGMADIDTGYTMQAGAVEAYKR